MAIWHKWNLSHGTGARHAIAWWRLACIISLSVYTGCAAYAPPPLSTAHPAHPEAMAAPEPPRSVTLAYGPADRPIPQPASAMAAHGMPHGAHTAAPEHPAGSLARGS
ncbi:MAG: hypothetical protein AB7N91_29270 [Candidatus Tectimicrobiota bacterium]